MKANLVGVDPHRRKGSLPKLSRDELNNSASPTLRPTTALSGRSEAYLAAAVHQVFRRIGSDEAWLAELAIHVLTARLFFFPQADLSVTLTIPSRRTRNISCGEEIGRIPAVIRRAAIGMRHSMTRDPFPVSLASVCVALSAG